MQQTRTGEPATGTGMVSLQRIPVSVQQALVSQQQIRTCTQVSLQQIPVTVSLQQILLDPTPLRYGV